MPGRQRLVMAVVGVVGVVVALVVLGVGLRARLAAPAGPAQGTPTAGPGPAGGAPPTALSPAGEAPAGLREKFDWIDRQYQQLADRADAYVPGQGSSGDPELDSGVAAFHAAVEPQLAEQASKQEGQGRLPPDALEHFSQAITGYLTAADHLKLSTGPNEEGSGVRQENLDHARDARGKAQEEARACLAAAGAG
jgi:hypothetical protein